MGFDSIEFASFLKNWPYVVVFFGMFIDANITIITSAVLIGRNILGPFAAIFTIFIGGISEQFFWYWAGRKLGKRQFIMKWADKLSHRYDRHFIEKTFHSLVISKFIYGLHRVALIRIGMLNLQFSKFIRASLPSTVIWLIVVGLIGFFFSASFDVLKHYLKYGELVLLFVVVLYVAIDIFISRYLKKEL